jgi:hypothetical protein
VSVYTGPIELTLIYGQLGGLGRTAEPKTVKVMMQHMHRFISVVIPEIGVALLKAPGLTRAHIKLSDGTSIEGTVRAVQHDYFELIEDLQPAQV